jgi:hypothetical protein
VQKKARERMLELVNPALAELQRILTKPDTTDADRLRAITLLLDRTGYGPKSQVEVEVRPWQELMGLGESAGIFKQVEHAEPLLLEAQVVEDYVPLPFPDDDDDDDVPDNVIRTRFPMEPGARGSANPPSHQR